MVFGSFSGYLSWVPQYLVDLVMGAIRYLFTRRRPRPISQSKKKQVQGGKPARQAHTCWNRTRTTGPTSAMNDELRAAFIAGYFEGHCDAMVVPEEAFEGWKRGTALRRKVGK